MMKLLYECFNLKMDSIMMVFQVPHQFSWMLQFTDGFHYDFLSDAASVFMNASIHRWTPLWFSFRYYISFMNASIYRWTPLWLSFRCRISFYEYFNLQMDSIMTFFQVSYQFLWMLQFTDGLHYDFLSGVISVFMNASIYRWR